MTRGGLERRWRSRAVRSPYGSVRQISLTDFHPPGLELDRLIEGAPTKWPWGPLVPCLLLVHQLHVQG